MTYTEEQINDQKELIHNLSYMRERYLEEFLVAESKFKEVDGKHWAAKRKLHEMEHNQNG